MRVGLEELINRGVINSRFASQVTPVAERSSGSHRSGTRQNGTFGRLGQPVGVIDGYVSRSPQSRSDLRIPGRTGGAQHVNDAVVNP